MATIKQFKTRNYEFSKKHRKQLRILMTAHQFITTEEDYMQCM